MDQEFKDELLETIKQLRLKHKVFEPLNIVVSTNEIAISTITDNKPYNPSYREGVLRKTVENQL